jgi:beta-galactosidase
MKITLIGPLLLGLCLWAAPGLAQAPADEYLHGLYDRLHDSPMQQKFRRLAPVPAGVVYVQQPGEGEPQMRAHFKLMKKLGFNALKQIMPLPDWTVERIAAVALDEGIIPWWFGEGGYEDVTPALRQRLGLGADLPMAQVLAHPKMLAHQWAVLRQRNERMMAFVAQSPAKRFMRTTSTAFDPEIGGRGTELSPKGETLFVQWLKDTYQTVDSLNRAWNQHHAGLFLREERMFTSWDDVAANWKATTGREYRHFRDIFRFKVEHSLHRIRDSAQKIYQFDPQMPYRGGGELGLFHPMAYMGVDMEGIAHELTNYGSFYPSMHFSWHYDAVKHEVVRPAYMQASLMNDLFKGGWTGGWESTGGPQQLDGGPSPDNSYYVDGNILTQFYLNQIAAGFKGFGIWAWSVRTAGKEAGEYGLLDKHGHPTDRAVRIGQLGQALQQHRFELWQAHKEPVVGVLYDWENEAVWTAMSIPGRESFRMQPVQARVGVSRALINANVPFEYVTPTDLRRGLAGRYKVIYLPAFMALQADVLDLLRTYAQNGGRVVLDLPGAKYDEFARLLNTDRGSPFERLFGTTLDDHQHSGNNVQLYIDDFAVKGMVADLTPTTGRPVALYHTSRPAVVENALGKGSAVLLGFEASRDCFAPGQTASEQRLLRYALGGHAPGYTCEGAIAYRLASPGADHYFLLNDSDTPKSVRLAFQRYRYRALADAITGEKLDLQGPIALERHGGRWVRAAK